MFPKEIETTKEGRWKMKLNSSFTTPLIGGCNDDILLGTNKMPHIESIFSLIADLLGIFQSKIQQL
uniref:Uncharacterized protein n=1 Tax=Rhizophora mucronata TaxID=61149 RepID=A0A2P2PZU9_RHIMU